MGVEGERTGVGGRKSEVSALWDRLEDEEVGSEILWEFFRRGLWAKASRLVCLSSCDIYTVPDWSWVLWRDVEIYLPYAYVLTGRELF